MSSVIIYSLNDCGEEVKDLNRRSLDLEKGGSFAGSFELIQLIRDYLNETPEQRAKFSDMIEKELLERASFLQILLKDFEKAIPL